MKVIALKIVLGLSTLLVAFSAIAGPGDGSAVLVDEVEAPDLLIQDLRQENYDASHAPIKVRIGAEASGDHAFKSARLTAWLTTSLSDLDAPRLSEVTITVGKEWANRSLVIEVPSPGEGIYFVHVSGELRLANADPVNLTSTTTQKVRFGKANVCQDVEVVAIPDSRECPVRFDTKSVAPVRGVDGPANERLLHAAAAIITDLCESNSLQRVSVRGWASTRHSVNPTNEELARGRATAVVEELQLRVAKVCRSHIYSDSLPGTRGVTTQFGDQEDNQCAQIVITQHTCTSAAPSPP